MKKKIYSFELIIPKGYKNDYIIATAKNKTEAKIKLLEELNRLNAKCIKVTVHKEKLTGTEYNVS